MTEGTVPTRSDSQIIIRQTVRGQIKLLHPDAIVPGYGTAGACAMDLRVMLPEPILILQPGEQELVGTGIALQFDAPGYGLMIMPRSSAGKAGIVLGNIVALIDEDYTGEIMLLLWNRGNERRIVEHGERVAQLAIVPMLQADLRVVDEFERDTARGAGGFGSTGKA
ncbi:MAG TPA: dUTP diphosphatase [Noviherbaspirillum sp.]